MNILRTFMFSGYNRLGPCPLHHYHLGLDEVEWQALRSKDSGLIRRLEQVEALVGASTGTFARNPARSEDLVGEAFARLALALQRAAGHRVDRFGIDACELKRQTRPWFEYDHPDSGHAAAELAAEAVRRLLAGAELRDWLNDTLTPYVQEHAPLAIPADTRAIIDAAMDRGIPRLRMDRPPTEPVQGDFRLRAHSLLRLGQGSQQHTVDGTFCVSRSEPVFGLVRDREARLRALAALDLPVPSALPDAGWCLSESRAARAFRRIGRPVAVRPVGNLAGRVTALAVDSEEAVRAAARSALRYGKQVLVEPFVSGGQWLLLVAGGQCRAVLARCSEVGGEFSVADPQQLDASVRDQAERIAARLDVGMLAVQVAADDLGRPLAETGGAIVDVDLAPRLDRFFEADDPLLRSLAGDFVDWLFPEPERSRVPVISVTGTNGKTTTARMLHWIMQRTDRRSALACSDGSFIGANEISDTEDGHLIGHLRVLDHPETELAVLESTRGSAGSTGLGFERCRVGICLNVSEDHLDDELAIASVEEMARIKRSILEASEDAVVLNADNRHCLDMLPALHGRRIGLVSCRQSAGDLTGAVGEGGAVALLESSECRDWLVVYEHDRAIPVIAVEDVPVCHGGRAVHNVSNALHAVLAAHFMGVSSEVIAAGLRELDTSFETHFGRLNRVEGLPFELIIDYAHNPDGMAHLVEFVRRTPVEGRRILNFSCSAGNTNDFIRRVGRAAAGSFELYVCKEFANLYRREPGEVCALLCEGLLEGGVRSESIVSINEEFESVRQTLQLACPGDLVVIVAGKRKRAIYGMIQELFPEREP